MNYFIVSSRGCTAGTWLAQALNRHPQVFCCHGRDRPGRGIETPELLKSSWYREDRLAFEQRQRKMGIEEYLKMVEKASRGEPVIGNVHGFTLPELIDKLNRGHLFGKFPIANITRNPISFVEDYTAKVVLRATDYPEKFRKEHLPRAINNRTLLSQWGIEGNSETLAFVEACQMLFKMSEDLNNRLIPHIQCERVTGDREYFARIAWSLTGLQFDDVLIDDIFGQGIINPHCKNLGIPEEIWRDWPPLKKAIFAHFIGEQQLEKFTSVGYSLSFLGENDEQRRPGCL